MSFKDSKGVEDFSSFSALSSCVTLGKEDDEMKDCCSSALKAHQRISEGTRQGVMTGVGQSLRSDRVPGSEGSGQG